MSKITYESLAVEGLKEVLKNVSSACEVLEIDFFVVGAIARNIWLTENEITARGTKDIDFGVYVGTIQKYETLKRLLIEEYGYHQSSTNAFCLIDSNKRIVDLLPFGSIEQQGVVMVEGTGITKINLEGFWESYQLGSIDVSIENETFKACSIPAVMILKLLAYDDRPELRTKDVEDINAICKYYPDLESEFIWEYYLHLYGNDREHRAVALIALGTEMGKILNENRLLKERIENILETAIQQQNPFLRLMIVNTEKETIEEKAQWLTYVKEGLSND